MKQLITKINSYFLSTFAFLFVSVLAFAQEKKIDVDIDTNAGGDSASGIFSQPWVWIVGAALFILLLVALLRGNRNS